MVQGTLSQSRLYAPLKKVAAGPRAGVPGNMGSLARCQSTYCLL